MNKLAMILSIGLLAQTALAQYSEVTPQSKEDAQKEKAAVSRESRSNQKKQDKPIPASKDDSKSRGEYPAAAVSPRGTEIPGSQKSK